MGRSRARNVESSQEKRQSEARNRVEMSSRPLTSTTRRYRERGRSFGSNGPGATRPEIESHQ